MISAGTIPIKPNNPDSGFSQRPGNRVDIPDEIVYNITKVIWKIWALCTNHRATRDMRMEIAIDGLGAPLHQGAIRYCGKSGRTFRRACATKPRMTPAISK